MQINHYQSIQSAQSIATARENTTPSATPNNQTAVESGVQVSISAQAQQLAKADNVTIQPVHEKTITLPSEPSTPLTGDKLEQAVQVKKAQLHYQTVADMANILSNSDNNVSASTAYYLSNNEDARELVVQTKSQQQTMANMQAYQEQTASLNEQYA